MNGVLGRFKGSRLARMSSGQYCLIRDLGLVKGGKGLRHHEVVLCLSWRGLAQFLRLISFAEDHEPPLSAESPERSA